MGIIFAGIGIQFIKAPALRARRLALEAGYDEGNLWRLTAREVSDGAGGRAGGDGRDGGPLFSATFEVPVFGT